MYEQAPFQQDAEPRTEYSNAFILPDTQKRRLPASLSPTEFTENKGTLPCGPVARECAYCEFRAVEHACGVDPQIIGHDRSDTMEPCGVILTTIKKERQNCHEYHPPQRVQRTQKNDNAPDCARESMKNTSSRTEKTSPSSSHVDGDRAGGHRHHPAHRATWYRPVFSKLQCDRD